MACRSPSQAAAAHWLPSDYIQRSSDEIASQLYSISSPSYHTFEGQSIVYLGSLKLPVDGFRSWHCDLEENLFEFLTRHESQVEKYLEVENVRS